MSRYAEIGSLLRTTRETAGMSRRQLAEGLHVHSGYPSRLEHGDFCPPPATLARIAELLRTNAADLQAAVARLRPPVPPPSRREQTPRPYRELGRLLRSAREAKRVGRTEMAVQMGISETTPGYWERGERQPQVPMLARLATYLGVDYAELAVLAGYAPQSIGEYTITVEDREQAAWLRQLAARFDAAELEALYIFAVAWQPRAVEAVATERRAAG